MRPILSLCAILSLVLVIAGCRPNEADLKAQEEARAAQDAAKAAEADVYAAETYRSATATIDDANGKFEQKEHDEATAGYMQAKELFDRAKSESETRKGEISAETQGVIDRVMLGISDTRASLDQLPRGEGLPMGKGADDDFDQISADLTQIEVALEDARTSLNNGQYNEALAKASDAEAKLSGIPESVSAAYQKVEEWKKRDKWYQRM